MISFAFSIINPFSERWRSIKCFSIKMSKSYAAEFNVYQTNQLLAVDCSARVNCDHAGVNISAALLGYCVELNLYNVNHCSKGCTL